ncbi:MAG: urease accessory protein UreE [Pseudomonadota bacterium]
MIRATHRVTTRPADATVHLDYDRRHRRRMALTTDAGEPVLLDLAEATRLLDGDCLAMDDGRTLGVRAEPEPVIDIVPAHAADLTRLAWHLGNRHTPTEILADRLRIRPDHVLEAMAERLGAQLVRQTAPFNPEAGAYADGGSARGHHHH